MLRPRPSAIITKRNVERGSPCLIPREGRKGEEGIPLIRTEKKEEDNKLITHPTQGGAKPKAVRVFLMYNELKQSNAFERSILRSIPGFLDCYKE